MHVLFRCYLLTGMQVKAPLYSIRTACQVFGIGKVSKAQTYLWRSLFCNNYNHISVNVGSNHWVQHHECLLWEAVWKCVIPICNCISNLTPLSDGWLSSSPSSVAIWNSYKHICLPIELDDTQCKLVSSISLRFNFCSARSVYPHTDHQIYSICKWTTSDKWNLVHYNTANYLTTNYSRCNTLLTVRFTSFFFLKVAPSATNMLVPFLWIFKSDCFVLSWVTNWHSMALCSLPW